MMGKSYKFKNSTLTLRFGNIIDSDAEVIVSSDDDHITMRGGVSKSIRNAGGEQIRKDAYKFIPCEPGNIAVTTAGSLPQKYIFHCVSRVIHTYPYTDTDAVNGIVTSCVRKCLKTAYLLGIRSIDFPSIGAGFSQYPIDQVAALMADIISDFMLGTERNFKVTIWLYDRYHKMKDEDYEVFFDEVEKASKKLCPSNRQNTFEGEQQLHGNEGFVFISYSRKDRLNSDGSVIKDNVVDAIKLGLERKQLAVWIDTSGIHSGEEYAGRITTNIKKCKAVVFISSKNSNMSKNVTREIALADENDKPVIPVIVDNAKYNDKIAYYLATVDRIDYRSGREQTISRIAEAIRLRMD